MRFSALGRAKKSSWEAFFTTGRKFAKKKQKFRRVENFSNGIFSGKFVCLRFECSIKTHIAQTLYLQYFNGVAA
jgi:formate/nitrite transporter FocA (FNT family)